MAEKRKRVRVRVRSDTARTEKLTKPIEVIVSGFGANYSSFSVGQVIATTPRHLHVQLRDEDGCYVEKFERNTGVRACDLNRPSGLKINLDDLVEFGAFVPKSAVEKNIAGQHRLSRIHTEEITYSSSDDDGDVMMVEVWEDSISNQRYFKAYRTGPRNEDDLKKLRRIRERGCAVPFSVLKKLLFQFETSEN